MASILVRTGLAVASQRDNKFLTGGLADLLVPARHSAGHSQFRQWCPAGLGCKKPPANARNQDTGSLSAAGRGTISARKTLLLPHRGRTSGRGRLEERSLCGAAT